MLSRTPFFFLISIVPTFAHFLSLFLLILSVYSGLLVTGERVVNNWAKFVLTVWLFVVLILTQSYTASLTSLLTVQQLQPTVTDVDMLLKNGDLVGFQEGSFVQEILAHVGFHMENLRAYRSSEELAQLFEKGSLSAAFDETPFMKVFLSTYCSKYAMVEPTFFKADSGFAFVS